MKKTLLFLVFLGLMSTGLAQQNDPISAKFDFVQGKIIVKLKDNVDTKTKYNAKGVGTSGVDIGTLLGIQNKVTGSKVLFSEKSVNKSLARKKSSVRDPRLPNPHTLKNTFVLELKNKEENILGLIEELTKNSNVEYAEPDYNYNVNDFTIDSDIFYPENTKKTDTGNGVTVTPDDPLYVQQTNITATNIDKVWDTYTTGDGSQIIAILDTGIDYNHPDLATNIWTNAAELNGVAGFDDDGNGYIDDIRGWDFINLDNAPLDDNMHGTHVAGIAGAVGNNGIGIAGAAWNVKLMPIKVFQSNGVGNASTIAQGIEYAANNGATIQNMSFGSYAESFTMRNALENAYATSVLVASAGNDALCIGPGRCPNGLIGAPSYPGAYTYVIGVQDAALYSNYDQDGPIFSRYSNLLNYELKAPGSSIMSTVPNGGYRTLTGTSMSSPLVAGGIALYLQQKPDDSTELLFGNLINTAGSYADILAAIEVVPTPELKVLSAITKDTISGQNGNDFLEPGEIIEIFPLVKNYWGPTEDVRVGIEFAEFEDQTKATIIQNEIQIGSISAYATLQDLKETLKITIAPNVANNVNIRFNLTVWSGPNQDFISEELEFIINIKNSILLSGLISNDMTLTPDKEYLVSNNVVVISDAVITILPGTILRFADNVTMSFIENSKLICNGTKENKIKIIKENIGYKGFVLNSGSNLFAWHTIRFTEFSGIINSGIFPSSRSFLLEDSLIHNCLFTSQVINTQNIYSIIRRVNINETTSNGIVTGNSSINAKINNYNLSSYLQNISNANVDINDMPTDIANDVSWFQRVYDINYINNYSSSTGLRHLYIDTSPNTVNNFIYNNWNAFGNTSPGAEISIAGSFGSSNFIVKPKLYLGSSVEEIIDSKTWHYLNNGGPIGTTLLSQPIFDWTAAVTMPYENAHGIVWKVVVNDKDAQDEFDIMDPVGVGKHEFRVYFNRTMDTNFPPQISYGIREPYTQKVISETGTWTPDGKIYTVSHEVKIGATDGINRIRVQGARDLDYFEIPIEDSRFNMLMQSAGSASAGFAATPGLGEISLEWEKPADELLSDVLGYNMYRFKELPDETFSDTLKINEILIADVNFKDFEVEEGTKYFYQYKILRTSLEETDFSKTVTTVPLTSKLGDANGDNGVDVMDLVQNVDYILGNNPQPFIFKAADVNNDEAINVLDIVGIVDVILNPTAGKIATKGANSIDYYSNLPIGDATFYWEGNDLYVESEYAITGVQLAFPKELSYTVAPNLPNFEWLHYEQDNQQITMMYSFGDLFIPEGKTKILTKSDESEVSFNLDKAVVGTKNGLKLNALYESKTVLGIDSPEQGDATKIFTVGPNPTKGLLNIFYYLPEQMDKVKMYAYDLQGKVVWSKDSFKNTAGQNNTAIDISSLNNGHYILVIDVLKGNQISAREVNRIIVNK